MDNIFFGDTENIKIGVKKDTTDRQIELLLKMYPKAEIMREKEKINLDKVNEV